MKSNSQELLSILSNPSIGFFTLVELNWHNNYYFTDLGRDITWNGNTYRADNPMVGVDTVRYSNVVDRELFKFSLSGLDPMMNAELNAGIVHKPVKVRMLFTIDDVPQTGINQTMLVYDGLVSKTDHKISMEDKLNQIECTAPLSDLDATGTLYTTRDGMKLFDPEDTSFDTVFEGREETSLKWGKS
jgi:hypothetical protein